MKRFIFLFFFLLTSSLCFAKTNVVVVSVAPYKFLVDAIAKDTVKVNLLVPNGVSFHDFEPTPRQVIGASDGDIWFRIGENFENHALSALKNHNPQMKVVDLRDGVDLILVGKEGACPHCAKNGADLHIWLSPKEYATQAKLIAKTLSDVYPENQKEYQENLEHLLLELDHLNNDINEKLSGLKNRTILVSHPAYAYFARDYNLKQLPIEFEGKDPSPRQLDLMLNEARKKNIHTIFVQREYGSKGAHLIANELNAKVVFLDPYVSTDYFKTLQTIAEKIANQDAPR